ncbi:hypothetical protein BDR06DRAFT_973586 [Suillus hirtellus]|nr:hypothetical protein BDR06DRAFT_973586 [Suillus hirtellus]
MSTEAQLAIIAMGADGAVSELNAQSMMDHEESDLPPLKFNYELYGYHLQAPVFHHTGPLILIMDPSHAHKTAHNQLQHGTHTVSLGNGYIINNSFVKLFAVTVRLWNILRVLHGMKSSDLALPNKSHDSGNSTIDTITGTSSTVNVFLDTGTVTGGLKDLEFRNE